MIRKNLSGLLTVIAALCWVAPALADSTISNLTSGGTVQTQDFIPIARPSSPGQNFKVNVGSAASQTIGTSGATVPLLNSANTWSAQQAFLSGDLTAADAVFTGGSILLPAGSTGARPGSPVNGMLRYNSTTPGFEGYVNGSWGPIGGAVAIGTTTQTAGTALDLSSNTNSMLLPVGTTGQRPGTGVAGMVRYNSTATPAVEAYINGAWAALNLTNDNPQASAYSFHQGDMGGFVPITGTTTITIPAISTTIFPANTMSAFFNEGSNTVTLSSTPTMNGFQGTSFAPGGWEMLLSNGVSIDAFGVAGQAASLNVAESFTTGQSGAQSTPAISTATFTPDLNAANSFDFVLVHASCPCTIANPANTASRVGQSGVLEIDQSSTGSDTIGTWGSDYKFAAATAPTLSTGASAQDYFSYYVRDSTHIVISGGVLNAH